MRSGQACLWIRGDEKARPPQRSQKIKDNLPPPTHAPAKGKTGITMEQVRWGILGCGSVCEVKSGPPLYKIKGSRLIAVMRRNLEAAKDFAKRHGVPKAYGKAEDLVNDPEVNAVYIAAPPGSHLELARMVAKAGKACYVEKPLARNREETSQIAELFREAQLPLYAAYYRRGQERFRYARDVVRSGKIGRVTSVAYRYCKNRHELDCLAAASAGEGKAPWRWQPEASGGARGVALGRLLPSIQQLCFVLLCSAHTALLCSALECHAI